MEQAKAAFQAGVMLTHYRRDLEQDHRAVADAIWQTFRDHLILEYEIPEFDGDLGSPNVFFPASGSVKKDKIEALLQHFASQRGKDWFDGKAFSALMRIRGLEC
jgi:LmbE family N-acetylglucosaminyl deacetylase